MSDLQHARLRQLFDLVFDASPDQRELILDRECRDNPQLRERVLAMIATNDDDPFLGTPTADFSNLESAHATTHMPGKERPGDQVGRYKLLQVIGEGGFGSVWMAEQKEPVRRKVALKIVKLGMDTKQVIARFEAERQALAMMDHPNIAKVFDAGATETGRPYFVMELVRGVPITEYCDTENLTTDERLQLLISVCHAAQHAHQKGIIHRDIKPSNVMVTLHDGIPVVKVIDFGIAKAMNRDLTDKTLFTEFRQFIGTPEYMSPEQAEMSGLDIDTRSDIYSMGVLMYELLTGVTPFDPKKLRTAGLNEIQRIIREEEPQRPSTRLSEAIHAPTAELDRDPKSSIQYISKHRRTDPRSLSRKLRGDLDWIIMKALEKDRARRYETASGFASDIQRYLADEPVLAGPPAATYRFAKLIKRNRRIVAVATSVVVALMFGVVGTTWGLIKFSRANRALTASNEQLDIALAEARDQRAFALANENRARSAAKRATQQADRATLVSQLIADMFRSVTPQEARGADTTLLKKMLDEAALRLNQEVFRDKLAVAELHHIIGEAYTLITQFPQAESHLQSAVNLFTQELGPDHPKTKLAQWTLGLLFTNSSQPEKAVPIFEEGLQWRTANCPPDDPTILLTMTNLARAYHELGKNQKAAELFEETLELKRKQLGLTDPDTLICMNNLGSVYWDMDRFEQAETLFEFVANKRSQSLGDDHPDTLAAKANVANVHKALGRLTKAEQLYLDVIPIMIQVLGENHQSTLRARANYAELLTSTFRFDAAERIEADVLERRRAVFAAESHEIRYSMQSLARVYQKQGQYAKAEPLLLDALEILRKNATSDPTKQADVMGELAVIYRDQGRLDQAETLLNEALKIVRQELGQDSTAEARFLNSLGTVYDEQGKLPEAEPLYVKALSIQTRELGERDSATLDTLNNLATLYSNSGRAEEAESMLLDLISIRREVNGPEAQFTLGAITNLGHVYLKLERYEDAAKQFEISWPLKEKTLSSVHPWTIIARNGLAQAYEGMGKHEEALHHWNALMQIQISAAQRPNANPLVLNDLAWTLLTHDVEALRDPQLALVFAKRACEAEEAKAPGSRWVYLDTLALAYYQTGDYDAAAATQRRALAEAPDGSDPEMAQRLATYEARAVSTSTNGPEILEKTAPVDVIPSDTATHSTETAKSGD